MTTNHHLTGTSMIRKQTRQPIITTKLSIELRDLYHREKMSCADIAKHYGLPHTEASRQTIKNWLRYSKVKLRTRSQAVQMAWDKGKLTRGDKSARLHENDKHFKQRVKRIKKRISRETKKQ